MNIGGIIILIYFLTGFLLTYIWWNNEYEEEYEKERQLHEVDESMAVLFLIGLTTFWPIKLIKDYIDGTFI